jgi:ribose-phosphate pyrophosphokinase
MKIIPGPASKELGEKISKLFQIDVVPVFHKTFPDGESYIRFDTESLQSEDVAIIQTTSPPQDQRIIQLLLMADNALDMNARSITAVVPYFAYSRQDKRFLPGEAFSIKTIVKLFQDCGIGKMITVNAHNSSLLQKMKIRFEDLSAIPLLAEHFITSNLVETPVSLSLGKKAVSMAKEADNILKGGFDYISTKRDVRTGNVTIEEKQLAVRNRDVIVFDDIISSGGTMSKAVRFVKDQRAKKVYSACVHPLLSGDSYRRILEEGADGIVGTDCVPSTVSEVSIATLIGEALIQEGA